MKEGTYVQLFGQILITRSGQRLDLSLVSAQKLIALLCLKPGRALSRADVASRLWDDTDPEVGRNRIRTALVQLRAALSPEDPIGGDKNYLLIEPGEITCDLWDARNLIKRAITSADDTEEEHAYRRILELIEQPFLDGIEDRWAIEERKKWDHRVIEIRLRIGFLAEKREDWSSVVTVVNPILETLPYDERVWAILLRTYSRLGRQIEIYERFLGAKKQLKRELNAKFSPGLLGLVDSVRTGGTSTAHVLPAQSDMAGRVLGRMLEGESPEDCLQFLGSAAIHPELLRDPLGTKKILDQAIERTSGYSLARVRCLLNGMSAASFLYDHARYRELGLLILENTDDLTMRARACVTVAFGYFQIRDWDKTYQYANLAVELAEEMGSESQKHFALTQRASFDWHMGKFEQAEVAYRNCLAFMENVDTLSAKASCSIITGNLAFVYIMQGQYVQGEALMQRSSDLANQAVVHHHIALGYPILGALKIYLGKVEAGREILGRGLGAAYRLTDDRSFEIGLDSAALGFSAMGKFSLSQALLKRAGELRAKSGHTRSVAEDMFANRVREMNQGVEPDRSFLSLTDKREMVIAILDALSAPSRQPEG